MAMSIEVILGPMFAGKTTELLRRVRRHIVAGCECILIKFVRDVRYDAKAVCTHDKVALDTVPASRLYDVTDVDRFDVIGIDEGQFFEDIVPFCEEMANKGKVVIVAALDGTWQRRPFGSILGLVPLAQDVVKLKAVCMVCHKDAAFTHRKHPDNRTIAIGGADDYMAVCWTCYHKLLIT